MSSIVLTDQAAAKIYELIEEEQNFNLKLRAFISGGGCSGFQYGFTFDEDIQPNDQVIEKQLPLKEALDKDDDDEGEEDYSDLDTHLVEVSDKDEKLLPDEDLKWEEDEDREEEVTSYEGGAPDDN